MTDHETAVNLDWVRYTIGWGEMTIESLMQGDIDGTMRRVAHALATMPVGAFEMTGGSLRPLFNYNMRHELRSGSVSYHTTDLKQRIMVDIPGAGCASYRAGGVLDRDLIEFMYKRDSRCTRLDIAIDYYGDANPSDMETAFYGGQCKTEVKKIVTVADKWIDGKVDGNTVYFGAPQSERRIRIYDKAAQMELDTPWVRIEVSLKGDAAGRALPQFKDNTVADVGKSIARSILDTEAVDWWTEATRGLTIEREPIGRPDTDTDKWLLKVVKPTLERRLRETTAEGNFLLRDTFYGMIEKVRKDTFGD